MSNILISEDSMKDIGEAIRAKLRTTRKYKAGEMAGAIHSI